MDLLWTMAQEKDWLASSFQQSALSMAFVSAEGYFTNMNPSFCALLGFSEHELAGKHFESIVQPDDRALIRSFLPGFQRNSPTSCQHEIRTVRPTGETLWILVMISHVKPLTGPPFYFVQIQDISERKREEEEVRNAYEALRKSEEMYRVIIEHSYDMISKHDRTGAFLYVSPASRKLIGYEPEELIGKNVCELFHPEDLPALRNALTVLELRNDLSFTAYRIRRKDGSYVWFETTGTVLRRDDGEFGEMLCTSRDISTRKQLEHQLLQTNELLQKISSIDALTGVANRRSFDESYVREWRQAMRYANPLSVILVDIDYFKKFNDTYGHQEGDLCLTRVAEALRKTVKRHGDLIARYGGEEFVIVLPNTESVGARIVAEQLRTEIERLSIPHKCSDVSFFVTASLGTATIVPTPDLTRHDLILRADKALYQAKKNGRNQVQTFETE